MQLFESKLNWSYKFRRAFSIWQSRTNDFFKEYNEELENSLSGFDNIAKVEAVCLLIKCFKQERSCSHPERTVGKKSSQLPRIEQTTKCKVIKLTEDGKSIDSDECEEPLNILIDLVQRTLPFMTNGLKLNDHCSYFVICLCNDVLKKVSAIGQPTGKYKTLPCSIFKSFCAMISETSSLDCDIYKPSLAKIIEGFHFLVPLFTINQSHEYWCHFLSLAEVLFQVVSSVIVGICKCSQSRRCRFIDSNDNKPVRSTYFKIIFEILHVALKELVVISPTRSASVPKDAYLNSKGVNDQESEDRLHNLIALTRNCHVANSLLLNSRIFAESLLEDLVEDDKDLVGVVLRLSEIELLIDSLQNPHIGQAPSTTPATPAFVYAAQESQALHPPQKMETVFLPTQAITAPVACPTVAIAREWKSTIVLAGLGTMHLFFVFVRDFICFDVRVMVDLLTGSETACLQYLLRVTKRALLRPHELPEVFNTAIRDFKSPDGFSMCASFDSLLDKGSDNLRSDNLSVEGPAFAQTSEDCNQIPCGEQSLLSHPELVAATRSAQRCELEGKEKCIVWCAAENRRVISAGIQIHRVATNSISSGNSSGGGEIGSGGDGVSSIKSSSSISSSSSSSSSSSGGGNDSRYNRGGEGGGDSHLQQRVTHAVWGRAHEPWSHFLYKTATNQLIHDFQSSGTIVGCSSGVNASVMHSKNKVKYRQDQFEQLNRMRRFVRELARSLRRLSGSLPFTPDLLCDRLAVMESQLRVLQSEIARFEKKAAYPDDNDDGDSGEGDDDDSGEGDDDDSGEGDDDDSGEGDDDDSGEGDDDDSSRGGDSISDDDDNDGDGDVNDDGSGEINDDDGSSDGSGDSVENVIGN